MSLNVLEMVSMATQFIIGTLNGEESDGGNIVFTLPGGGKPACEWFEQTLFSKLANLAVPISIGSSIMNTDAVVRLIIDDVNFSITVIVTSCLPMGHVIITSLPATRFGAPSMSADTPGWLNALSRVPFDATYRTDEYSSIRILHGEIMCGSVGPPEGFDHVNKLFDAEMFVPGQGPKRLRRLVRDLIDQSLADCINAARCDVSVAMGIDNTSRRVIGVPFEYILTREVGAVYKMVFADILSDYYPPIPASCATIEFKEVVGIDVSKFAKPVVIFMGTSKSGGRWFNSGLHAMKAFLGQGAIGFCKVSGHYRLYFILEESLYLRAKVLTAVKGETATGDLERSISSSSLPSRWFSAPPPSYDVAQKISIFRRYVVLFTVKVPSHLQGTILPQD
jgi:hypothetical protein